MMNQRGSFLLEVLIVSFMLAVLGTVLGMYMLSAQSNARSGNLITAGFLAQKQLAYLKSNEKLLNENLLGSIPWQDDSESLPIKKNGTDFMITTTIEKYEEEKMLRKILVMITWQEGDLTKKIYFPTLLRVNS